MGGDVQYKVLWGSHDILSCECNFTGAPGIDFDLVKLAALFLLLLNNCTKNQTKLFQQMRSKKKIVKVLIMKTSNKTLLELKLFSTFEFAALWNLLCEAF